MVADARECHFSLLRSGSIRPIVVKAFPLGRGGGCSTLSGREPPHRDGRSHNLAVVLATHQRLSKLPGVFMLIFINAFLIGTASGLRSLIGLVAVSWAAHA